MNLKKILLSKVMIAVSLSSGISHAQTNTPLTKNQKNTYVMWFYDSEVTNNRENRSLCEHYDDFPIHYHFLNDKVIYDPNNYLTIKNYHRDANLPLSSDEILYTGHAMMIKKDSNKNVELPLNVSFVAFEESLRIEGVWSTPNCRGKLMGTVM